MSTQSATNVSYSKGLEGVIAGETRICYIDSNGDLRYRGYDIQDLARNCSFEEVAHLLLFEKLPTKKELDALKKKLFKFRKLPKEVMDVLKRIPKKAPTMDVLRTTVSMAGHFDPVKGATVDANRDRALWLTSIISAIIATRYRLVKGLRPIAPKSGLSHAAQFLYQVWGKLPDETSTRTIDLSLTLYAEHEFNASTFNARVCGSTMSDMVSAIVGAIGTLKGPLHGGANEKAMELLKRFKSAEEAERWTRDALSRKEKIMGFGHRVYKHGDHRARLLEAELRKLAMQQGKSKWMDIYDAIKNLMVNKEKPIHPNVDYPCGLTYFLLGLPIDLYTPLFVAARVTGWTAHFIEQSQDNRIYRPLSLYTGPESVTVKPIAART